MTICELFEQFAREREIPAVRLALEPEAPDQLWIMMNGENASFEGHGIFLEEEKLFVFYTLVGARVPGEKAESFSRYLMSLNYRLKWGTFLIEESTGELTVRAVQYMAGADWEKRELIEEIVLGCGRTADRFYPEIMKELFG